ncbi:MAG: alpha/beta fold hydrolase [Jatrophihabitantaceae bacterium]
MTRSALMNRLRSRKILIPLIAVVVLAVVGIVAGVSTSANGYRTVSRMVTGTPEANGSAVRLDTTLYLPDGSSNAPAVLLAQGFGGDKHGLDGTAKTLAEHGYVALAYTARGFGNSGGDIHLDSPSYEVHDARLLVDYLVAQPQVDKDKIAVAGSSYGGGLSLLLGGLDPRIKAVAADITWNDLSHALFPNAAANTPGVFKKLWTGTLFGNGFSDQLNGSLRDLIAAARGADSPPAAPSGSVSCGRFAPDVCAAYQDAARTGVPNATLRRIMADASPASVLHRITAPTLLTQGEQDSLFPLSEADANARGIAANGTPVKVVWRRGGHDDSSRGGDTATSAMLAWFGAVFGGRVSGTQPFQFSEQNALLSSSSGRLRQQIRQAAAYPGIDGTRQQTTTLMLAGPPQQVSGPAGGVPAAITAVPGLSGILSDFGGLTGATASLSAVPSQTAIFVSPKLSGNLTVAGSSTVRLTVTPRSTTDATLFVALRDVAPDGTNTLPSQLVNPLRLTRLTPGQPTTVTVRLPAVVRSVPPGHRIVLTVATTDFAYQLPQAARTYTIGLDGFTAPLTVPTTNGSVQKNGQHPMGWLISGAIVALATMLGVGLVIRRRRTSLKRRPDLADVPVSIESLVKEYAGGYRAVDDLTFRVERGQVVGLLGPNGAGKTTVLRTLVGLITATSGELHVFGEPVVPGAAVLARLGAFIEGPGFLPHLSGRENLRLFWAATGRPGDEANFDTALEIAGLGASIDRRVKSYSHGMKQRLGIAQAMLGLPELLVLDEPTNGLDPPQIAEMREVMKRYAETGRTVVVSSHLLAEVEQTCTHVVVMHKGRLVASGPTVDIAGAAGMQLSVPDPAAASAVLAGAGITATLVPARRALEDVFLGLIDDDERTEPAHE